MKTTVALLCFLLLTANNLFAQKGNGYTSVHYSRTNTFFLKSYKNEIIKPATAIGYTFGLSFLYEFRENIQIESGLYVGKLSYKIVSKYYKNKDELFKESATIAGLPINVNYVRTILPKYSIILGTGINYNYAYKYTGISTVESTHSIFVKTRSYTSYSPQFAINLNLSLLKKMKKRRVTIGLQTKIGFQEQLFFYYRFFPYTEKEIKGNFKSSNSYIALNIAFLFPNKIFE